MDEEASLLAKADEIVSAHVAPPPPISEVEKRCVREFCARNLELQQLNRQAKESRKKLLEEQKQKRKALLEWMRAQGEGKCFIIPRQKFQEAETIVAREGLQKATPPYLRLQRTTTDGNITPSVAETAVMDLEESQVREYASKGKNPIQALVAAIVDNARCAIRTNRESIQLSESLEKGKKVMEVPELPEEAAENMIQLHLASARATQIAASHKPQVKQVQGKVKELEPNVASFLQKTGRTSQQIRLAGGGMHRISAMNTSRAGKVTLKLFEDNVSEALRSISGDTLESLWADFSSRKKQIVKDVQFRLNSLPKKTTSKVVFKTLGKQDAEDNDEEEEDAEEQ